MGYNLLVFASSSKRLAFISFVLDYYAHGQRLVGYLEDKIPGCIQSRFFLRSDASRHQVGYICWDFLFYVVVGLSGWTKWQDPFDDFCESHSSFCRKVDTGYSLSSWLDNDKGWSGDICDAVEAALLQRKGRREQEEEEAALLSKSRLWRV